MQRYITLLSAVMALLGSTSLVADSVTLTPFKDNTIFSRDDDTSNAQGILFTSANGQGNIRRSLLAFDVASHISPGSVVTSASLTLTLNQGAGGSGALDHSLHRLLQDWGEGTSIASSGNGASATPGDATWAFRFFPDVPWTTAGGEFVTPPSAVIEVDETQGIVTWASTAGLISDVQVWLDSPSTDFGWIVIGEEEVPGTARKFESRENPDPRLRPTLTVEFDPPASTGTAYFRVTKTFSDAREDEIEVTLLCSSGTPLNQSLAIEGGGAGVNFVVTNLQGQNTVCEVTESGGPPGYTPVFNDGAGCSWQGVTAGEYTCEINNAAEPATFTVAQVWVVDGAALEEVRQISTVSVFCNNEINGGFFNGTNYQYNAILEGNGDSLQVSVETTTRSAQCRADSNVAASGVESEGDCDLRIIQAGGATSCSYTHTMFFEAIPTSNRFGLILMALVLLGPGLLRLRTVD